MRNRGILIYAFNNERMDYIRIARYCASRIRRYWKLPVAVVTDEVGIDLGDFDQVINFSRTHSPQKRLYPDYAEQLSFFNNDRAMALALTPFDETILIDSDYLPGSDTLPRLWQDQPLLVARNAHSLSDQVLPDYLIRLHETTIPMYWATVMMFRKDSDMVHKFFQHWRHAVENYRYYSKLYKYPNELFRNDYAVSIAVQRLFDGVQTGLVDLPFSLPTALPDLTVDSVEPLRLSNIGRCYYDVHVMHKKSLLEAVCGVAGF